MQTCFPTAQFPPMGSLADVFRETADDFWYWCLTVGYRTEAWLRECLPSLPPEDVQKRYTGRAGDLTLEQAFGFYQICKQQLAGLGKAVQPEDAVLDFGCGWGRITRFWLKDVHPANLLGADVDEKAIRLCEQSNFPCRFTRLESSPPLQLPAESLDYIIAYSVFSHLSEASALAWMREFYRLLKPGGLVLATTRPREAILEFQKLRLAGQVPEYALGAAAAFADTAAALKTYDAGKFCFDALGGDPAIPGEYGEALIPLAYAQAVYGQLFHDIRLLDFKDHYRFDQNLLVLHKPEKTILGGEPPRAEPADGEAADRELPWTGERLVPSLAGQIAAEHLHRYAVAAGLAGNKIVLDLACGEGYGSALLAERARLVYGIDISASAIAHAGRKYTRPNLKFLAGPAEAIPLPDACLDLVVSFETIEHVREPETFLDEIKRCLKPGGTLIISSPDKIPYHAVNNPANPFHVQEYRHEEFIALLKARFTRVLSGKQKYTQGSHFAPDEPEPRTVAGTFSGDYQQVVFHPGVDRGLYSLAVCSDAELETIPFGVFECGGLCAPAGPKPEEPGWQERLQDLARSLWLRSNLISVLQRFLRVSEAESRQRAVDLSALHRQLQESGSRIADWERRHAESRKLMVELESQKAQLALQVRDLEHQLEQSGRARQDLQRDIMQRQQRLEWLRALLASSHERIQASRFAMTRMQIIPLACKQTLARKVWRWLSAWSGNAGRGPTPLQFLGRLLGAGWRRWRSRPSLAAMIKASGLFDPGYYLGQYPDSGAWKIEPLTHYLRYGADELKNPNPYFDSAYYGSRHPEIYLTGMNPLVHFLTQGEAGHADPGPMFDTVFYMENYPDVVSAGIPPFRHFWLYGQKEGRLAKAMSGQAPQAPAWNRSAAPGTSGVEEFSAQNQENIPAHHARRKARVWPEALELKPPNPRLLAFYLPQYHPIPENDEWWGKGFTEWENVAKARPLFPGHFQPQLPSDLGFYDLRVPEVREQQAAMARAFGVYGFCYYYYWFNGRKLLHRPLDEVLVSGKPDFPFCICWANENWTRNWDGEDRHILLEQKHSPESDEAFIHEILPILKDRRYIHYAGKPVLLVYRVDKLPDPADTARRWRAACSRAGLNGLHLCAVETAGFGDPRSRGFDALVEFPPNTFAGSDIAATVPGLDPNFRGRILDYREIMNYSLQLKEPEFIYHRGVMTAWDNTARKKNHATLFLRATPEAYQTWLQSQVAKVRAHKDRDALVFINAWNEWGEGAHLEPDLHSGYAFLESTQRARNQAAQDQAEKSEGGPGLDSRAEKREISRMVSEHQASGVPAAKNPAPEISGKEGLLLVMHDAYCHGAQYIGLAIARTLAEQNRIRPLILLKKGGDLAAEFAKYGEVCILEEEISRHASEQSALERLCGRLERAGVRSCLCNTVVTGDIAAYLKQRGLRVVSLVHELPTLISACGYQGFAEQLALHSDVMVFPSSFVQQAFLERFRRPVGQLLVRPQGIVKPNPHLGRRQAAKQAVAKRHGLAKESGIVLNCGYADMRKGPELFLAVARSLLQQEGMDLVHFIWAGHLHPEACAWLQHDSGRAGLDGRVHWVGFQSDDLQYLAAADVFALTSREDPFPNVVLSAMEAGVPVVAFAGSGGAGEVLDSGCGLLVPYLDVQAMAGRIGELLRNPDEAARIGARAKEKIQAGFGMREYVNCLLGLLRLPAGNADM